MRVVSARVVWDLEGGALRLGERVGVSDACRDADGRRRSVTPPRETGRREKRMARGCWG